MLTRRLARPTYSTLTVRKLLNELENILFPDKIKPDSEEIVKEQKMNQVDSPELSEQRTNSISA